MLARIAPVAALLGVVALALWHPAPKAAVESSAVPAAAFASPLDAGDPLHRRHAASPEELVVYVVGAVKRPGLYQLRPGDRFARAVALAGGMSASGDAAGVNLAQRASDGEEIDVPFVGQAPTAGRASRIHAHRGRRRSASPPPEGSVDLNAADAAELSAVPGIGRSIAGRIVELREREGNFTSLDELLDVAGMTQSRLERARPYLREP
jgi:competence protein ComEA